MQRFNKIKKKNNDTKIKRFKAHIRLNKSNHAVLIRDSRNYSNIHKLHFWYLTKNRKKIQFTLDTYMPKRSQSTIFNVFVSDFELSALVFRSLFLFALKMQVLFWTGASFAEKRRKWNFILFYCSSFIEYYWVVVHVHTIFNYFEFHRSKTK